MKSARVKPERRTRGDLIVTAVIVVMVAVAGFLAWYTSEARKTDLQTATTSPIAPQIAEEIPEQLRELWRARSSATDLPGVARAAVGGHHGR
ncbi:MAG: hypothetical protein QM658_13285, partial [Gordonia sp. (in: high G+C Gram-positive bacteria)]